MDEPLPGEYIAGLTDGEGCFSLSFRRDVRRDRKGNPISFYWKVVFAIVLRSDDQDLLFKVRNTLHCGEIYPPYGKGTSSSYRVSGIDDLQNIVVPFFRRYPLQGKKRDDFQLWAEAVKVLCRAKKHGLGSKIQKGKRGFNRTSWNEADLRRLEEAHSAMRRYKAKRPKGYKWAPQGAPMVVGQDASLVMLPVEDSETDNLQGRLEGF